MLSAGVANFGDFVPEPKLGVRGMLVDSKLRWRSALWSACVLWGAVMSIPVPSLASDGDAQGFEVLPESLAEWYKPKNERQVWLHTMFAMRRELQAIAEYAGSHKGTLAYRALVEELLARG